MTRFRTLGALAILAMGCASNTRTQNDGCPNGQLMDDNGNCFCADGQPVGADGKCPASDAGVTCPGDGGTCPAQVTCGDGTAKVGTVCELVATDGGTTLTCGDRTTQVGTVCEGNECPAQTTCGEGTSLVGTVCTRNACPASMTCGNGTAANGTACEAIPACAPGEQVSCVSGASDGGTCTINTCGTTETWNATSAHCDEAACPVAGQVRDNTGVCQQIAKVCAGQYISGDDKTCVDAVETVQGLCPAGQRLDTSLTPPKCVSTPAPAKLCPGQFITGDDAQCVDAVATVQGYCTVAGQLLDTTMATPQCVTPPAPKLCPGQFITGDDKQCVAAVATVQGLCPSGQWLDTSMPTPGCKPLPANPLLCPGQFITGDDAQCIGAPNTVQGYCTGGKLLDTATNPPSCVTPPAPKLCPGQFITGDDATCVSLPNTVQGYCPSGQWLDTSVTPPSCKTPPPPAGSPRFEASWFVKPETAVQAQVGLGQTGVAQGTLATHSTAGSSSQVTQLVLPILAADVATGPFAIGGTSPVLAKDHVTGCLAKDWPPNVGTYGPAPVDSDGRVRINIPANTVVLGALGTRMFDIQCNYGLTQANGSADYFAVDVESVVGNVVGGAAMASTVVSGNGNPPSYAVSLSGCSFVIKDAGGTQSVVGTKMAFAAPSSGMPTGNASPGLIPVHAFTASVPSCTTGTAGNLKTVEYDVAWSDNGGSSWGTTTCANPSTRMRFADSVDLSTSIATIVCSVVNSATFHLTVTVNTGQTLVSAGTPRTFYLFVSTAGAATIQHDTVQALPSLLTSWTGTDGATYPAKIQAPDFAALVGNVRTMQ